jgi:hypothetical protein
LIEPPNPLKGEFLNSMTYTTALENYTKKISDAAVEDMVLNMGASIHAWDFAAGADHGRGDR